MIDGSTAGVTGVSTFRFKASRDCLKIATSDIASGRSLNEVRKVWMEDKSSSLEMR